MRDNINNQWGTAPDKGTLAGPVLEPLNSSVYSAIHGDNDVQGNSSRDAGERDDGGTLQGPDLEPRQGGYWLESAGSAGLMPLAPSGYQFFRNVKDFGAAGDGKTDDTAAINRALAYHSTTDSTLRCGADCGSTTTLGALVYFPAGTYVISTPLIMYYYTQTVGDPTSKPTIQGSFNFSGIALADSDFYIPGGNGDEWYIDQRNFYRQIRNLVLDMTVMNWTNTDGDQQYVPAGVHWQVGQATSITNW